MKKDVAKTVPDHFQTVSVTLRIVDRIGINPVLNINAKSITRRHPSDARGNVSCGRIMDDPEVMFSERAEISTPDSAEGAAHYPLWLQVEEHGNPKVLQHAL